MTSKSRLLKIPTVEREIGERGRAAKLRLRFDKVVRRLTGNLKATLASVLPHEPTPANLSQWDGGFSNLQIHAHLRHGLRNQVMLL